MAVDRTAAVKAAASKLGAPYVWGAEGPNSFDCSGLMQWAWNKGGLQLPRVSQQQAKYGKEIPLSKAKPGDLITSDWGGGPDSHVAMYVGNNKVIHAPRPGRSVTYATIDATYRSKIGHVRQVPGAGGVDPALDLGDIPGLGGVVGGTLMVPLTAMAKGVSSVAGSLLSVGKFAEFLLKLALPSTWVRIVCGLLGGVLLLLGLGFLVREAQGGA